MSRLFLTTPNCSSVSCGSRRPIPFSFRYITLPPASDSTSVNVYPPTSSVRILALLRGDVIKESMMSFLASSNVVSTPPMSIISFNLLSVRVMTPSAFKAFTTFPNAPVAFCTSAWTLNLFILSLRLALIEFTFNIDAGSLSMLPSPSVVVKYILPSTGFINTSLSCTFINASYFSFWYISCIAASPSWSLFIDSA